MNAIEIHDLRKSYKDFQLEIEELKLPEGCILGLVGENGAGKSTTIKLILEIIKKEAGVVKLFGKAEDKRDFSVREDIGVVLDEVSIPQCLTAVNLGKIMKNTYKNWDDDAYKNYLKRFKLPTTKKFKDFSRGMKTKLGIAVALSHNAKLLILDEATSGLDPLIRDEILDIFMEFTRDEGHSILMSSHIVSDLEKVCDYIAFIHNGRVVLCEEKDGLKEQYGLIRGNIDIIRGINSDAIIGKKASVYGMEAVVRRNMIPSGIETAPIDIEQLYLFMTRGE